ncbi:MAG: hypothetical protein KJ901_11055, partial [Gammaproteobacteria bacterium]|nr:hypothetical protein [Gammaproteobacteria bacterium]
SSIPQRPAGARGTQLLADLPRRRHRWLWITVALVLLAGGAVSGYLFYRRVQDRRIAEAIGPVLNARGLLLIGLDVIGGSLTEINVTSPTCFQEISEQTGFDVPAMFIDALEAEVRGA